ncbi:rod shape determining protein RodA [Dysgonomonadaceae bacterium PH5-43]|nr:rod shape determining protein RodA [Dysgonomonadaceae bacterium PH5-43]
MYQRKISVWNTVDWFTILLYAVMVMAGWFSIYASSYNFDNAGMFDLSTRAGMQLIWIGTSLVLGFVLLLIDRDWYELFSIWIYAIIVALLMFTIVFAPEIKGSRSWLVIVPGVLQVQPAEFSKFATALLLARILSVYKFDISNFWRTVLIFAVVFLPMILILLQKETGSALVFMALFVVLYREGMPGGILFAGFAAVLFFVLGVRFGETNITEHTPMGMFLVFSLIIVLMLCILYAYPKGRHHIKNLLLVIFLATVISSILYIVYPFNICWALGIVIAVFAVYLLYLYLLYRASTYLWAVIFAISSIAFFFSVNYVFEEVLQPHQRIRIQVSLGIVDDPIGAGYNVNQSKIAIGSGGVLGKGHLNGTQTKLKYVPEQDTDFIFCTIGEEQGFVGSSIVIILFLVLILRLIYLAEKQRSVFNRVYGYSVASIIFFHLFVNVGMVIGITPVIGIPLPFFSYGGSSLWAFTILLFIFLKLDDSKMNLK